MFQQQSGESAGNHPPPPPSSGTGAVGELAEPIQILKVRDDHEPIKLRAKKMEGSDKIGYLPTEGSVKPSWMDDPEKPAPPEKLRSHIEPWLTALFQSEHLSLLAGSGLSIALHCLAAGKPISGGMASATFGAFNHEIAEEAKRSANAARRRSDNIEDQIRVACEIIAGLRALEHGPDDNYGGWSRTERAKLIAGLNSVMESFAQSILGTEAGVIQAEPSERENAFQYLTSFLMSFASRTGTRDRLSIFTTNYDRSIEAAADLAGLRLIDRFVGSLNPVFRSSRLDVDMHYNPPGIRGEPRYLEGVARYTKLHGSVDWIESEGAIRRMGLPYGATSIAPYLAAPGLESADPHKLMIYPNASKDRETSQFPYVELFRDFAAAICRPNSTVITYGYSFGDEHINRVIEDMLTVPSTHLVIISRDDKMGRIMDTFNRRPAQISLLIGDHLGDLASLVDYYLPKPAIDRTTFRMAELLKSRFGETRRRKSDKRPEGEEESPF